MEQYIHDISENEELEAILIVSLGSPALDDVFNFEMAMRALPIKWRAKVASKKTTGDIQKALCNRLLQLFGCSTASSVPARSLSFGIVKNGKPVLQNQGNIAFSMSNGEQFVTMYIRKVAPGQIADEVGIDIASVKDIRDEGELDTLKDIFAHEEMNTLRSFSGDKLKEMFAYYWSFKESYTKFTGTGISCDLTAIDAKQLGNFNGVETVDRDIEGNHMHFRSQWLQATHREVVTVCSPKGRHPSEPRVYMITIEDILNHLQSQ